MTDTTTTPTTTAQATVLSETEVANIGRAYNSVQSVQKLVRSHRALAVKLATAERVIDWYADETLWEGDYPHQIAKKARDFRTGVAKDCEDPGE